jgi:hypothetical protein
LSVKAKIQSIYTTSKGTADLARLDQKAQFPCKIGRSE